jgi:hypothetical protein
MISDLKLGRIRRDVTKIPFEALSWDTPRGTNNTKNTSPYPDTSSEVSTRLKIDSVVFGVMIPCSLVGGYQHFGGTNKDGGSIPPKQW